MKDAARMADDIANGIESSSSYLKSNWKTIVIIFWMLLVTLTLIRMGARLNGLSSHNQVANLNMSVDDVRYSTTQMTDELQKLDRSVSKLETSVSDIQSNINRIHTELRNSR